MSSEQRREEYLAKAREAEAFAIQCADSALKESWLRIAAGYSELAKFDQPVSSDLAV